MPFDFYGFAIEIFNISCYNFVGESMIDNNLIRQIINYSEYLLGNSKPVPKEQILLSQLKSREYIALFCYMKNLLGFNKKPAIIKDEKYGEVPTSELYSFSDNPYFHATFLNRSFDHNEMGFYGPGIYVSTSRKYMFYLPTDGDNKMEYVLPVKLDDSLKTISLDDIELLSSIIYNVFCSGDKFEDYLDTPLSDIEGAKQLYEALVPSLDSFALCNILHGSSLAMLLGYDAIVSDDMNTVIVLNRSKVLISEKQQQLVDENLQKLMN